MHSMERLECRAFSRICGSIDMFGPHEEVGFPGGLASARTASAGFNSASFLDSCTLAATVPKILPPEAPFGQDYVLKKSLLFASLISQVPFLHLVIISLKS
jgi:hypothetical protein